MDWIEGVFMFIRYIFLLMVISIFQLFLLIFQVFDIVYFCSWIYLFIPTYLIAISEICVGLWAWKRYVIPHPLRKFKLWLKDIVFMKGK